MNEPENQPAPPELQPCAYCGQPAEGNYAIHRDSWGLGPKVDLCDACGSGDTPTLEDIWDTISQHGRGEN